MKVSIDNVTGVLIEMQSHGDDDVLAKNAKAQGFTDVTVKEVTQEEFDLLIKQSALVNETQEQTIARLEGALDVYIDKQAQSYRYESIRTMVTYAPSTHVKFGAEGKAAIKFRDAVYAHGIKVLEDVQAGLRPVPTEAELIAELPKFTEFLPAA